MSKGVTEFRRVTRREVRAVMIVSITYGRSLMTVKEELHQLVEQLPERSLMEVRQFIDDLRSAVDGDEENLDAESLESLDRGLTDMASGRVKRIRAGTPPVNFSVSLTHEAEKTLDRIDRIMERRIRARLHQLASDPFDSRAPRPDLQAVVIAHRTSHCASPLQRSMDCG